eukprot:6196555-Pleurochrysis_carterae.AAC.3
MIITCEQLNIQFLVVNQSCSGMLRAMLSILRRHIHLRDLASAWFSLTTHAERPPPFAVRAL